MRDQIYMPIEAAKTQINEIIDLGLKLLKDPFEAGNLTLFNTLLDHWIETSSARLFRIFKRSDICESFRKSGGNSYGRNIQQVAETSLEPKLHYLKSLIVALPLYQYVPEIEVIEPPSEPISLKSNQPIEPITADRLTLKSLAQVSLPVIVMLLGLMVAVFYLGAWFQFKLGIYN